SPLLPSLGRLLGRLAPSIIGEGTDGPDEGERLSTRFQLAVEVRGIRRGRAQERRALLRGADPYGLTALIAASGAEMMCAAGYDRSGVIAPASAVDPRAFLDSIEGVAVVMENSQP